MTKLETKSLSFVRAIEGEAHSVIYIAGDGSRVIRSGGTWGWRNNNPGNMKKGKKSRSLGSIGVAVGFAIFPDYTTGRNADRELITTTYLRYSLFYLPKKYAPPNENDVARYRRRLKQFTGFDLKRVIRDLSKQEIEILLDAIQRIEGYKIGKEEDLPLPKPIIDVKRDKKKPPIAYLVEDLGWLSPAATVKGILKGEIDGVVAHRAGRTYVKTRPDGLPDDNLSEMDRDK